MRGRHFFRFRFFKFRWSPPEPQRPPLPSSTEGGFTLIEIMVVTLLLVFMSGLAVSRFGGIDLFRYKSAVRHFINTWEFLRNQAVARGESYRLIIDLDRQSYTVRREVPLTGTQANTVDHLRGFRTTSELAERAKEDQEKLKSLEEEYKEEDAVQGDALENLFYRTIFRDPDQSVRLGIPLEFPSLKDEQRFPPGVAIRDVVVAGEEINTGLAAIRFSASGASEFAVVHFLAGENIQTAVINPATGRVDLHNGDLKFEWSLAQTEH
jgi:type II secretory pathway pseudopilin PulG